MTLTPYQQAFILHFGEMGSRWGINRTVGQIYALLYVHDGVLNADEICDALGMSRSNVSLGLKELQSWNLVRPQHLPGDRREYFAAPEDVWQIFRTLLEERRKREIEPTLSMLRGALLDPAPGPADRYAAARMREMLELVELVTGWLDEMGDLDRDILLKLLRLGRGVRKFIGARGAANAKPSAAPSGT